MLLNDLFTMTTFSGEGGSFRALLELNVRHRIFEGHFPGQPVVPGVCLMQLVKELTEHGLGEQGLRLVRADQMKFIAMIVPGKAGELEMRMDCKRGEDGGVQVAASLLEGGKTCYKFNGTLVPEY